MPFFPSSAMLEWKRKITWINEKIIWNVHVRGMNNRRHTERTQSRCEKKLLNVGKRISSTKATITNNTASATLAKWRKERKKKKQPHANIIQPSSIEHEWINDSLVYHRAKRLFLDIYMYISSETFLHSYFTNTHRPRSRFLSRRCCIYVIHIRNQTTSDGSYGVTTVWSILLEFPHSFR